MPRCEPVLIKADLDRRIWDLSNMDRSSLLTTGFPARRGVRDHALPRSSARLGRPCRWLRRLGDSDVFGAEVNAASKLGEDVAGTGEILLTESARAAVGTREGLEFSAIEQDVAGQRRYFRADSSQSLSAT
jgi:hypothetical protein